MPQLELTTIEENSPEHLEMQESVQRYEKIYAFYKTIDISKLVFKDFDTLQSTCKKLIAANFGKDDEDFIENVRCLRSILEDIQPWA